MPSIKKNFFYSSILTTANYIFPLLTFPYASRVLGVTNIGIVNFVDSIIHYFTELMCEEFKFFCEMKKALDCKSPMAEMLNKPEVKKPEFQVF